jgi:hypothetical protein
VASCAIRKALRTAPRRARKNGSSPWASAPIWAVCRWARARVR